jgi:hypothetical protein
LTQNVNLETFLAQAELYDQQSESRWDKLRLGLASMNNTHPFPVIRSREIKAWSETEQYTRLLKRMETKAEKLRCQQCENPVQSSWKFCQTCGAALTKAQQ